MSTYDFTCFNDLIRACFDAGLGTEVVDLLSDELIDSIHDAAQRIDSVSPVLAAHITVLTEHSGYRPKMAAAQLEQNSHLTPRSPAEVRREAPRSQGQGSATPARHDLPQIRTSAGGLLSRSRQASQCTTCSTGLSRQHICSLRPGSLGLGRKMDHVVQDLFGMGPRASPTDSGAH